MRLATFNMQHGEPARGRAHAGAAVDAKALVALADQIRACEIDVLCLQEVDQAQRRSDGLNQTEILARELAMPHARFAAFWKGWVNGLRWQPLRSDAGGRMAFGVATLSRLPVSSWHVKTLFRPLPAIQVRDGEGWNPFERLRVVDTTRGALGAVVETAAGPLAVVNTHLASDKLVARRQLRTVAAATTALPNPHLLVGDLNLEALDATRYSGLEPLVHADTYSNRNPRRQIDHVLGTGAITPTDFGVEALDFSDHRLLWVDLPG